MVMLRRMFAHEKQPNQTLICYRQQQAKHAQLEHIDRKRGIYIYIYIYKVKEREREKPKKKKQKNKQQTHIQKETKRERKFQ